MANLDIINLYSKGQQGGELPYFIGKQYGSGWLRTLGRIAFPILKRVGNVAANTAKDVLMNDGNFLSSLKKNALSEVGQVLPGVSNMFQSGEPKTDSVTESKSTANPPSKKRKNNVKATINKHKRLQGTIFKK